MVPVVWYLHMYHGTSTMVHLYVVVAIPAVDLAVEAVV
jgi:hypothetical protein